MDMLYVIQNLYYYLLLAQEAILILRYTSDPSVIIYEFVYVEGHAQTFILLLRNTKLK